MDQKQSWSWIGASCGEEKYSVTVPLFACFRELWWCRITTTTCEQGFGIPILIISSDYATCNLFSFSFLANNIKLKLQGPKGKSSWAVKDTENKQKTKDMKQSTKTS